MKNVGVKPIDSIKNSTKKMEEMKKNMAEPKAKMMEDKRTMEGGRQIMVYKKIEMGFHRRFQ